MNWGSGIRYLFINFSFGSWERILFFDCYETLLLDSYDSNEVCRCWKDDMSNQSFVVSQYVPQTVCENKIFYGDVNLISYDNFVVETDGGSILKCAWRPHEEGGVGVEIIMLDTQCCRYGKYVVNWGGEGVIMTLPWQRILCSYVETVICYKETSINPATLRGGDLTKVCHPCFIV